ncbi:aspartate-semialdehyde dehydrogenase [Bryobacter aggregatus]|uniref:aspartate-semialdehyde dehydrogenase n=1 Tax=Bryobacter aggregatus TaxID=360054 RepID=UPI0004E1BC22|nr:aspartate-semialdehyde dehydrogenase [Bryobacter aggregatus]
MSPRIEVGVLGATGMVGQQFARLLANHPWFDLTWVGASDRSAGKRYKDATSWRLDGAMPESVANLTVNECKPGNAPKLVFSSMDANVATEIEQAFAEAGHIVVSNSKNFRMEDDVPLLVPEVNADHLALLRLQRENRGWKGGIVTNPNCVAVPLAVALAPFKKYGILKFITTSMQAVSGAGYPGVPSMDILGNVIPYISGEEPKVEIEPLKILGELKGNRVENLAAKVSAHCNRVGVIDGHTLTVSVELEQKPTFEQLLDDIQNFRGLPQERNLPSAPPVPLLYLHENNRPQPRRDGPRDNGMTVTMGRLRPCSIFDWKFVCLGHNTVRGAAGAAVLNAELMHSEGLL